MKNAILGIVNSRTGIKGVDLALAVMEVVNPQRFDVDEFHSSLEELILAGEVVELEYCDPDIVYRIKSIFLKKGTELLSVRGGDANTIKGILDRQSEANTELSRIKT